MHETSDYVRRRVVRVGRVSRRLWWAVEGRNREAECPRRGHQEVLQPSERFAVGSSGRGAQRPDFEPAGVGRPHSRRHRHQRRRADEVYPGRLGPRRSRYPAKPPRHEGLAGASEDHEVAVRRRVASFGEGACELRDVRSRAQQHRQPQCARVHPAQRWQADAGAVSGGGTPSPDHHEDAHHRQARTRKADHGSDPNASQVSPEASRSNRRLVNKFVALLGIPRRSRGLRGASFYFQEVILIEKH